MWSIQVPRRVIVCSCLVWECTRMLLLHACFVTVVTVHTFCQSENIIPSKGNDHDIVPIGMMIHQVSTHKRIIIIIIIIVVMFSTTDTLATINVPTNVLEVQDVCILFYSLSIRSHTIAQITGGRLLRCIDIERCVWRERWCVDTAV